MAYGNLNVDVVQSSTSGTPPQFNDGNGTQVGTLCRAWVNFNGVSGSVGIRASFNVSSITRNGAGDYTVTFTNTFSDANYSTVLTTQRPAPAGANLGLQGLYAGDTYTPTSSSTRIITTGTDGTTAQDRVAVLVAIFR